MWMWSHCSGVIDSHLSAIGTGARSPWQPMTTGPGTRCQWHPTDAKYKKTHTHTHQHAKLWAKVTKLSSKRTHICAFLKIEKRLKLKKSTVACALFPHKQINSLKRYLTNVTCKCIIKSQSKHVHIMFHPSAFFWVMWTCIGSHSLRTAQKLCT